MLTWARITGQLRTLPGNSCNWWGNIPPWRLSLSWPDPRREKWDIPGRSYNSSSGSHWRRVPSAGQELWESSRGVCQRWLQVWRTVSSVCRPQSSDRICEPCLLVNLLRRLRVTRVNYKLLSLHWCRSIDALSFLVLDLQFSLRNITRYFLNLCQNMALWCLFVTEEMRILELKKHQSIWSSFAIFCICREASSYWRVKQLSGQQRALQGLRWQGSTWGDDDDDDDWQLEVRNDDVM